MDLIDHFQQQSSRDSPPTMNRNNGKARNQPFWLPTRFDHEWLRTAVPDQLTIDLRDGQHRQPLNEPASPLAIPLDVTTTRCHHDGQRLHIERSRRPNADRFARTLSAHEWLKSHEVSHATFNGLIAATWSRSARRSSRSS